MKLKTQEIRQTYFSCYLTPNFDTSLAKKVSNYKLLNLSGRPMKMKQKARERQQRYFRCNPTPNIRVNWARRCQINFWWPTIGQLIGDNFFAQPRTSKFLSSFCSTRIALMKNIFYSVPESPRKQEMVKNWKNDRKNAYFG